MSNPVFEVLLSVGVPVLLFTVAWFAGSAIERKHYRNLLAREKSLNTFPVTNYAALPPGWNVDSAALVSGSVVISLDYFKRIVAGLRGLIGGRVKTYEPLLDRARREALLRMTEHAQARGFNAVVNVRLETSRLASARRGGKGTAGIEILAFGTALTLR